MIALLIALAAMLTLALALLCFGYDKNLKKFSLLIFCFMSVAIFIFFITSDWQGLRWWQTQGKAHYQLLQQVENLGGIDGMIAQVEKRVVETPDNAEGWLILGKLYLAKPNL